MSFYVGKIIKKIREDKGIILDELRGSLYQKSALKLIEQGTRKIGKWEADMLIERLGGSPDKYGCLYLPEEQEEFLERDNLLYLLRLGKGEELRKAWKKAIISCSRVGEEKQQKRKHICQKQFLEYVRLISYYGEGTCIDEIPLTWEERLQAVKSALDETQEKDVIEQTKTALLGRVERALVALYADMLCQKSITVESGLQLFERLLIQTEYQINDREELCFQYACTAALALRRMGENGRYREQDICSKMLILLRDNKKSFGLKTLICYELESGIAREKNEQYQRLLAALDELEKNDEEWFGKIPREWKKSQLEDFLQIALPTFSGLQLGKMVSHIREKKNLSREDFSDRIGVDKRTLERLERGESNVNMAVYQAALRNLGQEECRYFPYIMSDDYRMHECHKQVSLLMSQWKYQEAEKELNKLELGLDMDVRINQQCVRGLRISIDERLGRITQEERLFELKKMLALTVPEDADLSEWPLRRTEINTLVKIANTLEALGDVEGAETLLKAVMASWKRYQIGMKANVVPYLLMSFNLERYLDKNMKYEEALAISNKALQLAYRAGEGENVVEFLCKIGWNKEFLCDADNLNEKRRTCLPLYKQAFEIATAIGYEHYIDYTKEHCSNMYNESV